MSHLHLRKFDHDDAIRRHAAGETLHKLAREYGVHYTAVQKVIQRADPAGRARLNTYSREYQRKRLRQPCTRGCGRLAWHEPGHEGVCQSCAAAARAVTVRETQLLCTACGEWKSDDAFPQAKNRKSRRGRHINCRPCGTRLRQAYRERRKTPCASCGNPRLPASEIGNERQGYADTGLCVDCYRASRKRPAVESAA